MSDATHPRLDQDPARGGGRRFWLVLLIALGVGALLRGYGLNAGSLWIDEVWTVRDASDILKPGRPTRYVGYLPTGIVLYLFGFQAPEVTIETVHTWREQGLDLWHIRLAPCLIGIASIPLLGLAVRRALGASVAGVFMVLLACAPWHIYWSQLGRYYTLKFLLIGLALTLYYHATRNDRPRLIIAAMACVYAAYLVHFLSILIGLVFVIDIAVGYLRRRPIRLGVVGWVSGLACVGLAAATWFGEEYYSNVSYAQFVGGSDRDIDKGQSGLLVIANAAYMIQPALMLAALTGLAVLLRMRDRSQTACYWLAAGVLPVLVMAGFGFAGKFTQVRYTFEALYGVLILGSIGLAYLGTTIAPRFGKAIAAAPVGLVLVAMLLLIAEYHTTGHHLHRRWVDVFEYIEQHRAEGEQVVSPRPEVARYYLGDPGVNKVPGARYVLDRAAQGRPLWVVELGGSATEDYRWKFADEADLRAAFPIHVWQPYTELQVFYYVPRPREVWEAEAARAEAQSGLQARPEGTQ